MAPLNRREFLKSAGAVSLGTALGATVGTSQQAAAADAPSAGKGASDVLSLPKGGGAIQGIGETFKADPFTGSASFSVPIATSPGRSGFGPQLTLSYSSGSGNGPFGLGWSLSVPQITRKTEKGLPRYRDRPEDRDTGEQKDTFILSGAEDLVEHASKAVEKQGDFKVTSYRPRVEGLFAKIEKWERESGSASTDLQDVFWRVITRDNITNYYGRTPRAVIADVETGEKVFAWLLELTLDSKGNYIRYEYNAEDLSGIENDPYETNRRQNQKYLKRIRYGNFIPVFPEPAGAVETLLTTAPSDTHAFFLALFDYGEHGSVDADKSERIAADVYLPTKKWECRPDPFGTFRAGGGIELRTHRRCKRVLMFHTAIPDEKESVLVKSTDFHYENDPLTLVSRLVSVTQRGYAKAKQLGSFESEEIALGMPGVRSDIYRIKSMPPVEFGYTEFKPGKQRRIPIESMDGDMPPSNLGAPDVALVDLFGTGLQDVIQTTPSGYHFWRNRGGVFDRRNVLREQPAGVVLGQHGVGFGDMNGNGQADLLVHSGPMKGYWEATNQGGWKRFHPYRKFPTFEPDDPNVRMFDLTGDGTADALRTDADSLVFIPCLGEDGFDDPRRIARQHNLKDFPDVYFNDTTGRVRIADMNGDGLRDIVLVYSGTCAWYPNLGYGNFGKRILMNNAPNFGANFDPRRLLLLDIDGDGTGADLVYIESGRIRYWLNQAGKCWSGEQVIEGTPEISNYTSVQVADMLGNGTSGILWSGNFRGNDGTHYVFLDLAGGVKPNLLTEMSNNLGATTRVQYTSSCSEYLEDLKRGQPWRTTLPFPVQVVKKVEVIDHVSRTKLVTSYSYHHGYYAGNDREFRGFGRVEQLDSEVFEDFSGAGLHGSDALFDNKAKAYHAPPVLTKTWFHTGAYPGDGSEANPYAAEYCSESRWTAMDEAQAKLMSLPNNTLEFDQTQFASGLPSNECRDAWRALRGSTLRREIFACDTPETQGRPYSVSESNYCVRILQPAGAEKHAVVFAHPRETLDLQYERKLFDVSGKKLAHPRVTHSLTLEVDNFGNVLKSAALGYGRRHPDMSLSPVDRAKQTQIVITYTENRVTNAIEAADDHLTPRPCESRKYELTGLAPSAADNRLTFDEVFKASTTANTIEYQENPTAGLTQKRLIEHVRTYYQRNDLAGPLPLGEVQALALLFDSYMLAFTPGLVAQIYGGRATEAMFQDEGRYVHTEGDANWWIPSGRVFYSPDPSDTPPHELEYARQHFFLPRRYRDPFHTSAVSTESLVTFDNFDLLVQEACDALGNRITVGKRKADDTLDEDGNDYRVLQPRLIMDPNRNCSEVVFNALGLVVGTAVMGKPEDNPPRGDRLDASFKTDLTHAEIDALYEASDPHVPSPSLLGDATTRIVYDLNRFRRSRSANPKDLSKWEPVFSATLARESHASDGTPAGGLKIQVSFSYSDGFGREIQKKVQAEPGPVPTRDLAGKIIVGADNQPQWTNTAVTTRWVGSGWTIFNNKGKPVRQYEPFFSAAHRFEFGVQVGVSPILFYDPLQRVVATLHPNRTYEKVVFDPWRQLTYDVNDTVIHDPSLDKDVKAFFIETDGTPRLPTAEYLPTWYALRTNTAYSSRFATRYPDTTDRINESSAASKAKAHANTPAVAYFDSLGRPYLTLAHNGFKGDNSPIQFATRVNLDIEGNQREVIDAKDRLVMRYGYDMLGSRFHHTTMEAGERWILSDVTGKPLYAWDSRNHRFHTAYDALRRPTDSFLREGTGPELLIGRTFYGESSQNPEFNNLRGKVVEVRDQAGVVTTDDYDFKGNLRRSQRNLAQEYKTTLDWSISVPLETAIFASVTRYDALNRPTQLIAPHSDQTGTTVNVIQPVYNAAGLLEKVSVWLNRNAEPPDRLDSNVDAPSLVGVSNIDYDAKGQRTSIDRVTKDGRIIRTTYAYDRETFRLTHLYTRRGVDPSTRQGNTFTDDCDNPQPPPPTIAAPEEPSQGKPCGLQNLHYTYDPVGNIAHVRDEAQQTIFFKNQLIEPNAEYTYDPIYRLIQTTGREHLGQAGGSPIPHSYNDASRVGIWNQGPGSGFQRGDGNAIARYCESYVYDEVGNLSEMIHHRSCPGVPSWTRAYLYNESSLIESGKQSNRLSGTTVGSNRPEQYAYDAHGNMLNMPQLNIMQWDFRDQLRLSQRQAVNSTDADGVLHQGERTWYVYDSGGQRVRKVTELAGGQLKDERIYLGNFEVYRKNSAKPLVRETLHIMDDKQRVALVETRTQGTDPAPKQLIRYQCGNHLGSAILELDDQAQIISYEEYFPYGSTSYQAVRSQTETAKRYRYTGKERDEETGLYYHGARYYAAWLARWCSADPAGLLEGTNLYQYAISNPVLFVDKNGMQHDASFSASYQGYQWMQPATREDQEQMRKSLDKDIKLGPVGEYLGNFMNAIGEGIKGILEATPTILGAIIGLPESERKFQGEILYGEQGIAASIVNNMETNARVAKNPEMLVDALSEMSEESIFSVMGDAAGKTFLLVAPTAKTRVPGSSEMKFESGTSAAERLSQAGARGAAFEKEVAQKEMMPGRKVAEQLSIEPLRRPPAGTIGPQLEPAGFKFRIDVASRFKLSERFELKLKLTEAKSTWEAPLTANQSAGFPLFEEFGGIVRGQKGATLGLEAGAFIGPLKINIVRPTMTLAPLTVLNLRLREPTLGRSQ